MVKVQLVDKDKKFFEVTIDGRRQFWGLKDLLKEKDKDLKAACEKAKRLLK